VILAVDAIFPPLTGIGRYAWELASGLQSAEGIAAIRYFAMGRWIHHPEALLAQPDVGRRTVSTLFRALEIRRRLARSPLAVRAYSRVSPLLYWYRLRRNRDYLFHSPNYFLPPFPGPAVATFHDLSVFRYPEFHPPARVELMHREIPKTLRRAACLITDSEAIRREVIEFFSWPAERVTAVPLGVDAAFRPRAEAEVLRVGAWRLCVVRGDDRAQEKHRQSVGRIRPPAGDVAQTLPFGACRGPRVAQRTTA
jgi:glycosyltransferase involved in cell wall biosynthesis